MKNQDLMFEINGTIQLESGDVDSPKFENEIFSRLDKNRYKLESDLREALSNKFKRPVDVQLRFEKGSILVTGMVIIKWVSIAGGVLNFIDYAIRIISWTSEQVLSNHLGNIVPGNVRPLVYISTNSLCDELNEKSSQTSNSDNIFSLRNILITITLVNIIIFLGGSIYNFTTVDSIKDQYLKSKEELTGLNFELKNLSSEVELNHLNAKLALENLPIKLEKEFSKPLELKRDSILLGIINIKNDMRKLQFQIKLQNDFYNDSTKTLIKLLDKNREKKSIKVGIEDLKTPINLTLILCLVNFVLVIILFFVKESK